MSDCWPSGDESVVVFSSQWGNLAATAQPVRNMWLPAKSRPLAGRWPKLGVDKPLTAIGDRQRHLLIGELAGGRIVIDKAALARDWVIEVAREVEPSRARVIATRSE